MTHQGTRRTSTTLSDGRELFYYDDADNPERHDELDEREPTPRPVSAELRYDALLDEWVAVAASRQSRPFLPTTAECPLCPSKPGSPTEIPAHDYEVAVFENRFPSFGGRIDGPAGPLPDVPPANDAATTATHPAVGRCEVVCFTSDHDTSFAGLKPDRVRLVIDALADRSAALAELPEVAQVFCFENRGEEIGVTLHHPHGQIYAYPYIAPVTGRMLASLRRHRGLFDDILATESAGSRVVARNDEWIAFVPAAARWPFEVHLYPNRKVPDLPALPASHRDSFGPLYLDVLRAFDKLFDMPMPYISAWQQAPVRHTRADWRLHLRLFSTRRSVGKLKYLAGSESAMGAFVNDVPPETAAQLLRNAI